MLIGVPPSIPKYSPDLVFFAGDAAAAAVLLFRLFLALEEPRLGVLPFAAFFPAELDDFLMGEAAAAAADRVTPVFLLSPLSSSSSSSSSSSDVDVVVVVVVVVVMLFRRDFFCEETKISEFQDT